MGKVYLSSNDPCWKNGFIFCAIGLSGCHYDVGVLVLLILRGVGHPDSVYGGEELASITNSNNNFGSQWLRGVHFRFDCVVQLVAM